MITSFTVPVGVKAVPACCQTELPFPLLNIMKGRVRVLLASDQAPVFVPCSISLKVMVMVLPVIFQVPLSVTVCPGMAAFSENLPGVKVIEISAPPLGVLPSLSFTRMYLPVGDCAWENALITKRNSRESRLFFIFRQFAGSPGLGTKVRIFLMECLP